MTAGRNKTPLVGWHPSAGLVAWLGKETERRGGGRGVRSAILEEALAMYRKILEPDNAQQRRSRTALYAEAASEADESAPKQERNRRAKGPCEHRVKPGSFCTRCGHLI